MTYEHAVAGEHADHPVGWRRYVYSTNHKDIGTMYLIFAIVAGVIGGVLSIVMRMELQEPESRSSWSRIDGLWLYAR